MNLGNENIIPSFKNGIVKEASIDVEDLLKQISALDKYYDYRIYKEFKSQYLIVAYRKSEKDTMLDISYMTADDIVLWLEDKKKETIEPN
jgi:hypothetical protein